MRSVIDIEKYPCERGGLFCHFPRISRISHLVIKSIQENREGAVGTSSASATRTQPYLVANIIVPVLLLASSRHAPAGVCYEAATSTRNVRTAAVCNSESRHNKNVISYLGDSTSSGTHCFWVIPKNAHTHGTVPNPRPRGEFRVPTFRRSDVPTPGDRLPRQIVSRPSADDRHASRPAQRRAAPIPEPPPEASPAPSPTPPTPEAACFHFLTPLTGATVRVTES